MKINNVRQTVESFPSVGQITGAGEVNPGVFTAGVRPKLILKGGARQNLNRWKGGVGIGGVCKAKGVRVTLLFKEGGRRRTARLGERRPVLENTVNQAQPISLE